MQQSRPSGFLPEGLYRSVQLNVPIACVDFVPLRGGDSEVGLIRRKSPYGEVWCHLGGRIRRGETLAAALQRHLAETLLDVAVELPNDPQPDYVYQWFPEQEQPAEDLIVGLDERQHSIGLSFAVPVDWEDGVVAVVQGEALDFAFWPVASLPQPMWPGSAFLVRRLLERRAGPVFL